jgi:signal-transduction protein with cAMP-binding, CBS, and nucleotidyltransferase domain
VIDASKLMNTKKIRRLVVIGKNNKMSGILTQKDVFRAIDKNTSLFSEFYGENFSSKFKEIYEKFREHGLDENFKDEQTLLIFSSHKLG